MTTTQIKQSGANHVFGSTVTVASASPTVTDSANGFVAGDVGRSVTTTSTSGKVVSSITNSGTMVMNGNATASTGPQVMTLTPVFTAVTKKTGGYTDKTSVIVAQLTAGNSHLAQHAINVWTNCGGTGTPSVRAAKVLAAQGLSIQEA